MTLLVPKVDPKSVFLREIWFVPEQMEKEVNGRGIPDRRVGHGSVTATAKRFQPGRVTMRNSRTDFKGSLGNNLHYTIINKTKMLLNMKGLHTFQHL